MDEYMILLPDDEGAWERLDDAGRQAVYDRHEEFGRRLEAGGHVVTGGAELQHSRSGRTVRMVGGQASVTAGPPTGAAEQLSGFYLVQTEDLDGLTEACALLAADAPVEIRPLARQEGAE